MVCNYTLLLGYAISFVRIAALALGGYFLIGVVVRNIRKKFIHGRHDDLCLELISHAISYILFFGISVAIFHEMGINISAFVGIAGILGVALGYAAQSSMSNMISGIFLMFERPFKIGDLLIVDGVQGHVVDVNLFALVLSDASNALIRISHEQYRKSKVSNLSVMPLRRYDFCIEVHHIESLANLRPIIEQAIESNSYCAVGKKPYIEIIKIYSYTTTCAIGVWVKQDNILLLKSQVLVELKDALERHEIMLSAFYLGHDKGKL